MPSDWVQTTVGAWSPLSYGRALPEKNRNHDGHVPVFGSNGVIGFHDAPLTEGPAVVIGRKGSVGMVHYSPQPCWPIDTTFFVAGADEKLVRFRYYMLKSLGLEFMNGDSAVPGLNRDAAHARTLTVPSDQAQQREIAVLLGSLDDKIELNRHLSRTVEEIVRLLFRSWFVVFDPVRAKMQGRGLGLPAEIGCLFSDSLITSEIGEIPEGWSVRAVGDVLELGYGKALKESMRVPGDVPVMGSNGQIGWHNESLVAGPGIVIGRKGNPGTVTWCESDFFPIDTTFYVKPKAGAPNLYYLYEALGKTDFEHIAVDSAVPGLNRTLAEGLPILVPASAVTDAFAKFAQPLAARRRVLDAESRVLADIRDTLMPKLMSGEIRVDAARDALAV